ncbi:MAG: hypothetical protein R2736_13285 [Solirubrobacterales bacterium]
MQCRNLGRSAAIAAIATLAVTASAGAATVTPTVTQSTAPATLPLTLSGQLQTGDPIPTGSVLLTLAFPQGTPANSAFTVSCPGATIAADWGSGISADRAAAKPGPQGFTTMPGFSGGTAYVLCSPVASVVSQKLRRTARIPRTLVEDDGDAFTFTKKMRGLYRLIRVRATGLSHGVTMAAPAPCPTIKGDTSEPLAATPVANVSMVLGTPLLLTSTATATSASFTVFCLSAGYDS